MSDPFRPFPSISTEWTWRGIDAVILQNEHLRCTVLPSRGGRIVELINVAGGRDVLYHHPRVQPMTPVFGAVADDWWTGGIDEILPTGHRSVIDGQMLPDLGEFWSIPWTGETRSTHDAVELRLQAQGVITALAATRWLELRGGEPFIRARHRVANIGYVDTPLMWGIHPGLSIRPGSRIQVPGSVGVFWEGDNGVAIGQGERFEWPRLPTTDEASRDLSTARSPAPPGWELAFVDVLTDGWLAVTDPPSRTGFAMSFDRTMFPCVWVWGVYGGWRGLYTVAVEPWTAYPPRLEDVILAGRAQVLRPGQHLETEVKYIVFHGIASVASVDGDGTVHPHPEA